MQVCTPGAKRSSKLTILNDEGMHKRLEQSEAALASSSATQTSLLADLKIRLDETNSLVQATASETQALISRIDLYAISRIIYFAIR